MYAHAQAFTDTHTYTHAHAFAHIFISRLTRIHQCTMGALVSMGVVNHSCDVTDYMTIIKFDSNLHATRLARIFA